MKGFHNLEVTITKSGFLYECDECSRKFVIDRKGKLTFIDKGDPFIFHRGNSEELLSLAVETKE